MIRYGFDRNLGMALDSRAPVLTLERHLDVLLSRGMRVLLQKARAAVSLLFPFQGVSVRHAPLGICWHDSDGPAVCRAHEERRQPWKAPSHATAWAGAAPPHVSDKGQRGASSGNLGQGLAKAVD